MNQRLPPSTLFPYTTLFRSARRIGVPVQQIEGERVLAEQVVVHHERPHQVVGAQQVEAAGHLRALEVAARVHLDRKSTRLNSSHVAISYAVFCLKKKN